MNLVLVLNGVSSEEEEWLWRKDDFRRFTSRHISERSTVAAEEAKYRRGSVLGGRGSPQS